MRAWAPVAVPSLPGTPDAPLQVFDSVSCQLRPAGPDAGEARLYACGITPYDATHLGHAFTYVAIDLLHRVWLDAGLTVRYAQNVTDVDDPLLERATATGVEWQDLAAAQIDLFRADMEALRVLPPQHYVGVVEALDTVTDLIEVLHQTQAVYQLPDPAFPDWYFSVTRTSNLLEGTGLSVAEAEQLFAERGGDPARPGKRHQLDPLVWRQARLGEPSWESPFGRGRPGWHIECSAIALHALGEAFDVQAGGRDLIFPHHPMSAAGARVATGQPFARVFLHTGMVGLDGEKMSKSLGNLVFVSRLLADGVDPMAIRLVLLAHHYRTDWEYTAADLVAAEARVTAWRAAFDAPSGAAGEPVVAALRAALRADLDSPQALTILDEWAASQGMDDAAPGLVARAADALLGFAPGSPASSSR